VAWTWEWRAYPGVWLLVVAMALAYRHAHRALPEERPPRGRVGSAIAGIACVWLLLDWPIGPLGAGYLASVHMGQFLGLAFVAPPLLLFGLPRGWEAARPGRGRALVARVTRPLTAIVVFNAIVFVTHLPPVVDGLMVTQAGSFVFDLAWLAGGIVFWWPVVRRWPPPALGGGARMGYVVAGMGAHMGLGMLFALVPFALYGVYELAPPVGAVTAVDDQQRAGGLMLFGDVVVGLVALAFLVHAWQREERERLAALTSPPPSRPSADPSPPPSRE
jgi:putative membrane protein